MQLLWIRHAESIANQRGEMQGQADSALSERGRQQAIGLGRYLAEQSWSPSHVYSSPLGRAIATAAILIETLRVVGNSDPVPAVIQEPDLQEISNGIFQGLTWAEAQLNYPHLCKQLESNLSWIPIPGAETLEQLHDRSQRFIQNLLKNHQNDDRLWIISHAGILPYLMAALMRSDRVWGLTIPCTALFEFEFNLDYWHCGDHNRYNTALWQLHRFNQVIAEV